MAAQAGPLEVQSYPLCANDTISAYVKRTVDNTLADLYSQPIIVDFKVDYHFISWFTKRTGYYIMERGGTDHRAYLESLAINSGDFEEVARTNLPINTHKVPHALSQLAEQTEFAHWRDRKDVIEIGPSPKNLPDCSWASLFDGRTQARFIQASQKETPARCNAQALLRGLGAEHLDEPCTTLFANMVHDINHEQLYEIFDATGATSGRFTLMVPPKIILGADFTNVDMQVSFKFDHKTDTATMFLNDLSYGYTHSYSNLVDWITKPVYNGRDFSLIFEVVRSYDIMQVYQVTRVTKRDVISTRLQPGGVGMTRVIDLASALPYVKRWGDQLYQGHMPPAAFLQKLRGLKAVWVPTAIWNKAVAFGDARDDKHVNRQSFHSYLNALCYEITVSGHVVQRGYQLAPSAQNTLTMALLISCMVRRWHSTKALSYLTKEIQSGSSSLWQRFKGTMLGSLATTKSADDIYGYDNMKALTGISRRHFLLLQLVDSVDEPSLDFTALIKEHGTAAILNGPSRDVWLDIDPDDDGYCYHHCHVAAFGLSCPLPPFPTVGQIQAHEAQLGVTNSPIVLQGGHATFRVHADEVCAHLVAKRVVDMPQAPAKFPIIENWADNLRKHRTNNDSGLNILKTRELLKFLKDHTGSIVSAHNLCALPLNDLPAWNGIHVNHHVQSYAAGLDSSKLLIIPKGQSISFDTNVSCPECIPKDGTPLIADFGNDAPTAAQHIVNITNLVRASPRGAYKIQDFFKICASSDYLTNLVSRYTVIELEHANPWERFLVWGPGLPPGMWRQGQFTPWHPHIRGYGTREYLAQQTVRLHHNPTAWPQSRIFEVWSRLSYLSGKWRARLDDQRARRVFDHWRSLARDHVLSVRRSLAAAEEQRLLAERLAYEERWQEYIRVMCIIRQHLAATVIKKWLTRRLAARRSQPPTPPAVVIEELYEPAPPAPPSNDPSAPVPADIEEPHHAPPTLPPTEPHFDVCDSDSDRPPPFDEVAWASKFRPDGPSSLPKHDWSRTFHAPRGAAQVVDDESLKAWVQRPDGDISISELQAIRLWAYTYNAANHPLYKHVQAVGYRIFVQLRNPLSHAAYHGELYYSQELRGLPYVVEDVLPEPTDLDFGAFNPTDELHILLTTLKAGATGVYQKVNQSAIAHIQAEQSNLRSSGCAASGLLSRHIRGKVTAINGIPGCGKTHLMKRIFAKGGWDLVVCPTSALKEEYAEECIPAKTTTAALPLIKDKSLIIDESYKMGIIELCYILTHCKRALLVGDSEQTSFNASDYAGNRASRINSLATACLSDIPRITISRAVPLDVMSWIHQRWPAKAGYKTTNFRCNTVKFVQQSGRTSGQLKQMFMKESLYTLDSRIICFSKRAEQLTGFSTVNSQQGYRARAVGMYIGPSCATTIHTLPQQLYVGVTRHTDRLWIFMAAPAARAAVDIRPVHICPCRPNQPCERKAPCTDRCGCTGYAVSGKRTDRSWRIGARSNHGLYGHVAVKDVDFDTGPFASKLCGSNGEHGKIYSIPEEAQVNMQVHGSIHLAGEGFIPAMPTSEDLTADPAPVDVLIPPLKSVSVTAVDEVLQKLAPTSSDLYEFRRDTGYTNLGNLGTKSLRIKMRHRPILDPFSSGEKRVISVARCRSRAQTNSLDHSLQAAISRYASASSRLPRDEFEPEVQRLTAGLDKFIKIRQLALVTPEMLAVAEAEACQNIVAKKNPTRQEEGLYGSTTFATSTISCFNKQQDKAGLKTETWLQGSRTSAGGYNFKGGQPISASPKTINHICMAYVRCLELEIIRCRRPGVHLPNGTSTDDFKKRLDADIRSLPSGRYQTVCTDISEQDTTKTAAVHELVKRLFRIIGTPEHVIDILFSTIRAWAARGLDYTLWTLDAFQSGTAMTYLNNTIDNMARVGSAYDVATPFVAGFKGDDGFIRSQQVTKIRTFRELKVEEGVTGTFVGYLIGDTLTIDLPRLANKAACRVYTTKRQADEYATAVTDWLHLIRNNDEAQHMIRVNAFHYNLSTSDCEILWSFLVWYAQGGFSRSFFARSTNHTTGFLYKKILD